MESVFQQCVRELKQDGRTILPSSHLLAEVEALCDRVSIIRLGRTVESGTLGDLRHLTRTSITVESAQPIAGIGDMPGVYDAVVDGAEGSSTWTPNVATGVMRQLSALGVRSLTSTPPTLEDIFLRHYGNESVESRVAS